MREPGGGEMRDFLERPALFEEVRRARDDLQVPFAAEVVAGEPVQCDDLMVRAADDEKRRRPDRPQGAAGEIRPAAA